MPFGSLWRLCSLNRDSALAVAAATSSRQHFSYHSCVHRWERREKKNPSQSLKQVLHWFIEGLMFCCRHCFRSAGQSEPREEDKSDQSSVSQRLRDNPAACHLNRFRGGGFCNQEGEQICSRGAEDSEDRGGPDGTAGPLRRDESWGQ